MSPPACPVGPRSSSQRLGAAAHRFRMTSPSAAPAPAMPAPLIARGRAGGWPTGQQLLPPEWLTCCALALGRKQRALLAPPSAPAGGGEPLAWALGHPLRAAFSCLLAACMLLLCTLERKLPRPARLPAPPLAARERQPERDAHSPGAGPAPAAPRRR